MSRPARDTCLAALLLTPACCVAAATRIRTPHGEVAAGSLTVGNRVLAVDVATGALRPVAVVHVRRAARECLALRWSGGALVCTPDHPLYSPETGAYRPAADWVTGPARDLLAVEPDGVRVVTVTATEAFAGVHDVLDLTLDAEPHNFVADGVVVHNKSPATYSAEAETEGPTVRIGGQEEKRFLARVCVDGGDADIGVGVAFASRSTDVSTLNIQFELTVAIDGEDERTGLVPGEGFAAARTPGKLPCTDGYVVALRRSDEAPDGEIEVSWTASARFGEFYDEDEAEAIEIDIAIEPVD